MSASFTTFGRIMYKTTYVRNDNTWCFPIHDYYSILFQHTLAYINKPKEPATRKGHHYQLPYAQNDPMTCGEYTEVCWRKTCRMQKMPLSVAKVKKLIWKTLSSILISSYAILSLLTALTPPATCYELYMLMPSVFFFLDLFQASFAWILCLYLV